MSERTTVGTVEDLHASATRLTGLTDFGVDDYTEALGVLLDSYHVDEQLTPARQQGVAGVPPRRPGGAAAERGSVEAEPRARGRSDRAADLRHRASPHGGDDGAAPATHRGSVASGLEMWLTEMPQPRPPRETGNRILCSRRSRRVSAATTSNAPNSWACTTCRRARSRSAGNCCGRRSSRSPTSAWRLSRHIPAGSRARTGRTPISGTRRTCS